MKIIDEVYLISTVAERWREQYRHGNSWLSLRGSDSGAVYAKLKALPPSATAKDVEEIIGNDTWVCPQKCNECRGEFSCVIELGEAPDYESRTAHLCKDCVARAFAAMVNP